MSLEEFMDMAGLTDREVAQKLKISRPMVTRLRQGLRKPSWPVADRIRKLTNNAVPLETWVD